MALVTEHGYMAAKGDICADPGGSAPNPGANLAAYRTGRFAIAAAARHLKMVHIAARKNELTRC